MSTILGSAPPLGMHRRTSVQPHKRRAHQHLFQPGAEPWRATLWQHARMPSPWESNVPLSSLVGHGSARPPGIPHQAGETPVGGADLHSHRRASVAMLALRSLQAPHRCREPAAWLARAGVMQRRAHRAAIYKGLLKFLISLDLRSPDHEPHLRTPAPVQLAFRAHVAMIAARSVLATLRLPIPPARLAKRVTVHLRAHRGNSAAQARCRRRRWG